MKIKAGIVDDEKFGRDFIVQLLQNEFPDIKIAFTAGSLAEARQFLLDGEPEILFLDIELGDGNGFEVFDSFPSLKSKVIFVTAYDNFGIKAVKKEALDYILKPIEIEEFKHAVNKAIDKLKAETNTLDYIDLASSQGTKRVKINDIVRCEADSNYTVFYLSNKTKILISKTLSHFESVLLPYNFFRIHHKHLINIQHYIEFSKGGGFAILMSDGSTVSVALRRKAEFLEALNLNH